MTSSQSPKWLPLQDALAQIRTLITPIQETQSVNIEHAKAMIAASDVVSPINVPPFDNSAMDGYALRQGDTLENNRFKVVGTSWAGTPFDGEVGINQCVRIMTGAQMPKGADAVVMQENTKAQDETVILIAEVRPSEAVRPKGDDIPEGRVVLAKGEKITAYHIGLLASLGIAQVAVYRPIKLALFSSGDELTLPGQSLKPGHIYDSNRFVLSALMSDWAIEINDLGIIPDDEDALRDAFVKADSENDIVLCSGGVSVGDADYTKSILDELGQVDFWKIAIKPGKPLAFGRLPNSIFIGLPGNPVSAVVTFMQVASPALNTLSGANSVSKLTLHATSAEPFRKRPGRLDFQRAYCWTDEAGKLWVKPSGKQSSGVLSTFTDANCLAVLALERGNIEQGESIPIELLR